MGQKRYLYCAVGLFICIVVGIILGIKLTKKDSKDASNTNGDDGSSSSTPGSGSADKVLLRNSKTTKTKTTAGSTSSVITSDPTKDTVGVTMLAIGDFGSTKDKPGSCCSRTRVVDTTTERYKVDYWAQYNTANLLAKSAAEIKPKAIIGHGDNVYFNGLGPLDATQRMQQVFENVYIHPSLKGIPWFNVAGNHDLGGADYLCGGSDGNFVECESTDELIKALRQKFALQANYKSPDNDRWHLKDHYYKETVTAGGITIEVFNVDTNYADNHGGSQICCQCYGYSKNDKTKVECNAIHRGDKYCAGGNTAQFDTCMEEITSWSENSIKLLKKDLATSTATFKIINSHYSPHFHMDPVKMKVWYDICKKYNVQLFLNGHTHGFNHDISTWGTHFFENGAGGGIMSETSGNRPAHAASYVSTQWIASGTPYGFMELSFTKNNIKVQWVTFDEKWVFNVDKDKVVQGGLKRGHCWYVPQKLGKGTPCSED